MKLYGRGSINFNPQQQVQNRYLKNLCVCVDRSKYNLEIYLYDKDRLHSLIQTLPKKCAYLRIHLSISCHSR